jgi:UDP-N-acetylmuramate dehydrogenase
MTAQAFFELSRSSSGFSGKVAFDEPMSEHTTFGIGGPADLYVRPDAECFVPYTAALLRLSRAENIPVFIIGGGANLLVADAGIRGVALDTGAWSGLVEAAENGVPERTAVFRSGSLTDDVVRWAADNGCSGLEDFAGLPGTIGGAVWMNARCFGSQISDILAGTGLLDERLETLYVPADPAGFAYKKSPFQGRDVVILDVTLSLRSGDPAGIAEKTEARRREREEKGHFRLPSAGSVFKNNTKHGKPAGKIVEELGLRGTRSGGAQIAPWHGNFFVNTGGATAGDVERLIALAEEKALSAFGVRLEREVIFAGTFDGKTALCRRQKVFF